MKTVNVRIYGTIKGVIWMPCVECEKDFDHTFKYDKNMPDIRPINGIDCLRDALLKITNDGDFRECSIIFAVLRVTKQKGPSIIVKDRILKGTGVNSDCFSTCTVDSSD